MGYEIADIIKDHLKDIKVTSHQYNILSHLADCRTLFMGGHLLKCSNPNCNHTENLYNSCRDRNCPKCQGSTQIKWKDERNKDILPVSYSHITFTIPRDHYEIFQYNNKECYSIQFKSANEALTELAGNSKIGFISIIHTWTQQVNYHPHIHCVVPEIKINKNNEGKISTGKHVYNKESLNVTYKRILLKNMLKSLKTGELQHPLLTEDLIIKNLKTCKNYINIKSTPYSASVINYLGNFTKKIGITNERIKLYDGENVTFSYIDRTDGNKEKEIQLNAILFLKRFILHILPYKLTKIRYYGFMANNNKKLLQEVKTNLIKNIENKKNVINSGIILSISLLLIKIKAVTKCPCCDTGSLIISHKIFPSLSP